MIVRVTCMLVLVACFAAEGQVADSPKNFKPALGFIENKGQVRDQDHKLSSSTKFLLSLPGTNVVLKSNGFSYDTYVTEEKLTTRKKKHFQSLEGDEFEKDISYKFHRVDVSFVGGNPASIIPSEPSKDVINYYAGNEGDVTPMHHYGKVTYKNVYPNIDIEFVAMPGTDKPVEYNFIVHPGGDIGQIQLAYKGANQSALLNGKIELSLAQGKLTESIPASFYQKSKQRVAISYKTLPSKNADLTVGFDGSVKKPAQTLVIDPSPDLSWGTYFGGSSGSIGTERVTGIKTDVSGNVYITGHTRATSGIATSGSYQSTLAGYYDAFIAKFDSNGTLLWSTYYGGVQEDRASGISLDPSGNIYIGGTTGSVSGIATPGSHQPAFAGPYGKDGFVVKFNSDGIRLWGSYFGFADYLGGTDDVGYDVVTDASGNIFFAITAAYSTGMATAGAHQTVAGGQEDAVIVKFNPSGVRQWSTYYGGSNREAEIRLATDASGNLFVAGNTISSDNISTADSHQPVKDANDDSFIAKFTTDGVRLWGTYFGGTGSEAIRSISSDGSNIYVAGQTTSPNAIATPGAYRSTSYAGNDPFVAKFNSSGIRQWGTYIAYSGSIQAITVNQAGEAIGVHATSSSTFATNCAYKTDPTPNTTDGYIFKLNATGSALVWATYYGGNSLDIVWAVALDPANNVYVGGETNSNSGVATPGAHQTTPNGQTSAFLAKFSEGSTVITPAVSPNSPWVYLSFPATFTAANHQIGNLYHYSYVHQGTTTNVYSGNASTNVTLPALGVFQVRCVTTTTAGCTLDETFSIEVRKAIALCHVTIPLVNTGDIKLDKFSGTIMFQPNDACKEPIISTCIGGKPDAPFLNNIVSASATTFSDQWPASFLNIAYPPGLNSFEKNERGKWRPKSTHTFNKSINYQASDKNYEAGRFRLAAFNWDYPEVAKSVGWLEVTNISKYTPDGNPVEERNALNIASTAKFGYKGSAPYLIAQNAEYGTVYFESFENVYGSPGTLEENVALTGGTRTNSAFHSGTHSLSLTGQFTSATLTVNDQIRQKGLKVRAWVKGDIAPTAISFSATSGTVSAFKLIARSGEWALLESKITAIPSTSDQISISVSKTGGGPTWIDDVRIQPADAEMTCYVYDNRTLQLLTVFDDQHFGMFYQYNAEGKLVRKMVETEKGIKTLQETQYNLPTINKEAQVE